MTKQLIVTILICLPVFLISQSSRHKSQVLFNKKSGSEVQYSTRNTGLQLSLGGSLNYYDSKTKKYLPNYRGGSYGITFYYQNLLIGIALKPITSPMSKATDTIFFNMNYTPTISIFNYIKTEMNIGYTFNLPLNISIEPTLGYLRTRFRAEDEKGEEIDPISRKVHGFTVGFTINKYIMLRKVGDYIVIYLSNKYNYSNYSNYYPAMGNSYYSIELGLAFKGWFMKKTQL